MTAVMDRDVIAEAHRAALARHEERRVHFRQYTRAQELQAELDGRTLEYVPVNSPPFREARTAAEFWDDQLLRFASPLNSCPENRVIAAVAIAARDGGADAAVAAVRAARDLTRPKQYAVFANLTSLAADRDGARFGADRVIGQVLAEFTGRLKLQAHPSPSPLARA